MHVCIRHGWVNEEKQHKDEERSEQESGRMNGKKENGRKGESVCVYV